MLCVNSLQWNKTIYETHGYNLAAISSFWYIKRKYSFSCESVFNVTNIYINLESSCNSRTKTDFERFLSLSSASILNSILRKLMYHVSFPKKYLRHTKSYRVFDSLRKMNMLIIFHKFNLFLVERSIGIWIDFSRLVSIFLECTPIAICVGCILIKQNIKPHSLPHL